MKIKATKKVRELLFELDDLFQKQGAIVAVLADRNASDSAALNAGADKLSLDRRIIGCAWRINKASKGVEE